MASTPETGDIIANAATDFGGGPLRWTRTGANAASANAVDDYGRWEASLDSFQRLLWSAASATSDFLGAETVSDLTYQYAQENLEELSKYQRESMARGEVELGENFSKWLADTLIIDALPTITTMAGTAVSAFLTGGATLPALFAIGSTSVLNLGEIYGESRAEVGKENISPSVVLAATGVSAALDVITPYKVAARFFPGGVRGFKEKALQELGRNGGWNKLSRLLKEGAKGFNTEAYTEALQDYSKKVAVNIQEGKENPFEIDNDDFKDLLDAYLAGGVLGGTARGGTAFVGTGQAREIIAARDSAEERIGSDLDATVSPLEKELSDIEAKLKKVWPSSKERVTLNAEKRKLQKQIDQAKKDASDKRRKVRTSYTIDDINKIVPIKEETEAEAEAVPEEEKTLAQIMAEDPRTSTPLRTQPGAVLPVGSQRGPSPTQEEINARLAQEPSGPTQADVMPDVMPGTPVAPRPGTATAEAAARADQGLAQEEFDPSAALGTPVAPRPGTTTAEAAARADRGLQEEGFQDPSVIEDTIQPEGFSDPSVLLDQAPDQTVAGPQGRPRRSFAALREEIKARAEGPQVMNRPVINTVIGDSENVLVDGDVLITAADIEEAKFAKASIELEDEASTAYNEAYNEVVLETGGDHGQASIAGEEARTRVLREGGATRRRVYSSRAARLQAQREAAKQRQDREARLNFEAQRRIDERKKFEKEQAAELKEQAIEMAGETYDAFFYGQISAQEFASRRQSEIARIKDGIGGTAAANAYRKAVPLEKANAILKERGLPTLKPEGKKPTQAEVTPPAPKAAPKPTQAYATPPDPEEAPTTQAEVPDTSNVVIKDTDPIILEENKRIKELEKKREAIDDALETGSPELLELIEGKNLEHEKLLLEEMELRINQMERGLRERGVDLESRRIYDPSNPRNPLPGWIRKRDQAKKNIEALEAGVDPVTVPGTTMNPYGNKTPTQADATPPVPDTPTETAPVAAKDTEAAPATTPQGGDTTPAQEAVTTPDETAVETGKATTPPDVAVTDVDEDQTQDQQIAEMIAKDQATVAREVADQEAEAEFQAGTDDTGPTVEDVEVEPGVTTDIEAAPTGVDVTGEAVDMPAAPTTAEVVIEDTTPREAPVLEYAETTVNPYGVPIRIYEDPDTPGLNIVESEGVVLKRSTNRASAVTYANTNVTAETVKRKTPKAQAAPKARPEGKTYTGPKPKGASEALVKWLGSNAPFRATIGKQRASQARKVGLDPNQYTTEEELYDAIVAQVEAEPVEVEAPATDIAEEVQKEAEKIVPETLLERLSRERKEKDAALAQQSIDDNLGDIDDLSESEIDSAFSSAEDAGLLEDIDNELLAAEAAERQQEIKDREASRLEKQRLKEQPSYIQEMPFEKVLKALSGRSREYTKPMLVNLAENIKQVDPEFSYEGKNKADIASAIIEWRSGVEQKYEPTESEFYEESYDDVNDVLEINPVYKEAVRLKQERKVPKYTDAELESVEQRIRKVFDTTFGIKASRNMQRIGFLSILRNAEAKERKIGETSLAVYSPSSAEAIFRPEQLLFEAQQLGLTNKQFDKFIRAVVIHEVGVHAGADLVFSGSEFDTVLDELQELINNKDAMVLPSVIEVQNNYKTLQYGTREFLEEVLAHVIEQKSYSIPEINPSFFNKLKNAFKKFFSRYVSFWDDGERIEIPVATDMATEMGVVYDNPTIDDIFNVVVGHSMRNIESAAVGAKEDFRALAAEFQEMTGKDLDLSFTTSQDSENLRKSRIEARKKFTEDSVVKKKVYMESDKEWSAPVLDYDRGSIGLRVSNYSAADYRAGFDSWKITDGYVKIKNPFVMNEEIDFSDMDGWEGSLLDMARADYITEKEFQQLRNVVLKYQKQSDKGIEYSVDKKFWYDWKVGRDFQKAMRNKLIDLGYDAIRFTEKYSNSKGRVYKTTSHILLKDNQFKDSASLRFSSGTNVFMDRRSAFASPEKEMAESKKVEDIAGPQVTNTRKAQGKMFQALKKVQRAIEPLMTIEGYNELETQRMLAKGEIGKWHNYGRVVFDVLYQANAKEKKAILKYFETRGASPDDLPTRKVPVAKLPTVARGTRAKGSMAENRSIRDVAVQAKREIEELGVNLVKAGLITDEQYKKWKGKYLPKTYLKYIEKDRIARGIGTSRMTYTKVRSAHENFLKDVMEGRIEDPAFLAGRYISMAGADLSTINYLKFLAADTGKNGWVLPNQTINYEGMDGTVGYWNEYVNEMRSNITRMRELNPNKAKEMEKIADAIQKKIDSVGDIPSAEGYKKVPDNVRYGAMRGLFVKKEIIDDVMGLESLYTNNEVLNNVLSYSSKATKVFKYTKVPMNIPTQARNVISNVVLMDVSGTNFLRIPGLISRAITDIVQDGEYAQLARKYGIESTTFAAEELVNMDRELLKLKAEKDSWSGMWAKTKIFFNDYLDVGGRAYQKTEVMFKVAKMIDLMENHGKSEAEAARLANEALLDYSNVSQGVRVIRSMPLGSPFITFNLKAGAQMIRNIRNHPIAVAKYAAIPYIISEMLLDNNDDIEEEDIPAMQKLVADYMEGNLTTMILPWKDDEGRLRVFDMGYFLPWGAHLSMAKNLMEGEFGEAAKTPGFFGGPFELVAGIKTNVDPFTGQEIWNESDPPLQRYQDMLGFMASYAMPPMLWPRNKSGDVIGNGGQLIKTLMAIGFLDGNIDVDGLPKNTIPSSILSWLGINTSPLTKETAGRKLFFKGRYAKSIQSRLLKLIDDPNISEEDRNRLIDEYRMHQQNALDKYREYSEAFSQVSDVLD